MKKRIAIVGGGLSGLTAAYILHRDHSDACDFILFEADDRFGGTIETVHADGFTIECGPDSWVTEKPWAEQLARELGLSDDLLPSNDRVRRTYIARDGLLTPLPEGMRMMVPQDLNTVQRSTLFTDGGKQAYLTEPLRAAELREAALLHRGADADESVAAFVRRHFGDEVVRTVAGPLLAGVLGGDIERLSARALLGGFVTLEAQYGSLITGLQKTVHHSRVSVFTTLSNGLGTLVDRLIQDLPAVSTRLSSAALAIHQIPSGWTIESRHGREPFDRILIATPLDVTRRLLATLPSVEAQRAGALLPTEAASGLVVALGYSAGKMQAVPAGFGFLTANSSASDHNLLACTFLHQKFAQRAPANAALLRAFFASSAAGSLSQDSDDEIAAIARQQLIMALGPLPECADVTVVRRWPRSLPQYEIGHLTRIAQFESCLESLPGITVACNALRGVGLPDLVRDATKAAHALARD